MDRFIIHNLQCLVLVQQHRNHETKTEEHGGLHGWKRKQDNSFFPLS